MLSLPVYKYLSVFNMKQTAVVFEAKIRCAGSAVDLNNTSCADNIQGEKTREMKRGRQDDSLKRQNKGAGDEGGRSLSLSLSLPGRKEVSALCDVSR